MTSWIKFKIICTNIKLIFCTLKDVSIMVVEKPILKKLFMKKRIKSIFIPNYKKKCYKILTKCPILMRFAAFSF